jgi:glycosyltransferase involved in cell wall biosynthesis
MKPRVAFYAPLKSPRHPNPSGDRTLARLLWRALDAAGFSPLLASELRTLDRSGDPAIQAALRDESRVVAERLIARYLNGPAHERPALWFTYHVYYKAPDWIGPAVAEALSIPYVVAEASRASKRAEGPWALGHAGAEAALDRADAIFVLTSADRESLDRHRPSRQTLIDLPPFLDCGARPALPRPPGLGPVRLLAVGMMRPGDKFASYAQLADALSRLRRGEWTLDVAGDGPIRDAVEALFAAFGSRVRFLGRIEDASELDAIYARADLLVWPAVREAFGMAPLEAQAQGTPVLAGAHGGVASVVVDGVGGRLAPPDDVDAFAALLDNLLSDAGERDRLSRGAVRFARGERDLATASRIVADGLKSLLGSRGAA